MSLYEPKSVHEILKMTLKDLPSRRKFDQEWDARVAKRVQQWKKSRDSQSKLPGQLEWEADIVEYVSYINKLVSVHGNAKKDTVPTVLDQWIPFLGPHFIPPTYGSIQRRQNAPDISPGVAYLKPLHIIHPLYYSNLDIICPRCDSTNVHWSEWTGTGHCEVHGMRRDETALGYQLRCKDYEARSSSRAKSQCTKGPGTVRDDLEDEGEDEGQYCFATTSAVFWGRREHSKIPQGIPIFFKRCAVTRDLFDLIVEVRPSSTSKGLAEHIKQLHLLEYQQTVLQYLQAFKARSPRVAIFTPNTSLQAFSSLSNPACYADKPISSDLITDIILEFNTRTHQQESETYLRTLTAMTVSVDSTFKVCAKAKVTDKQHNHTKPMKGGVFSRVNERNEIITWRLCQTKANTEMEAALSGLGQQFEKIGAPPPLSLTCDDCCHMKATVKASLPSTPTYLDVYHFRERYGAAILNGTRNRHRNSILKDVTDAIMRTRADDTHPATYYNQAEQVQRLEAMYKKYEDIGGVWSKAAPQIHQDQMGHVVKGCLARARNDVASDGSRIEGSHKGWNSIMKTHSSGIEIFAALAHDFVLRRNLRIANAHEPAGDPDTALASFIASTYGSHHIHLVDHIAKFWNDLLQVPSLSLGKQSALVPRPRLKIVDSGESFGLVCAPFNKNINLELIKVEENGELDLNVFTDLNIDPRLFCQPASPAGEQDIKTTNYSSVVTSPPPFSLIGTQAPAVELSTVTAVQTNIVVAAEIVDLTGAGDTNAPETRPVPTTHSAPTAPICAQSKRKAAALHDPTLEQEELAHKRICTVKGVPSMTLAHASGASGVTVSPQIEAYFKSRLAAPVLGASIAGTSSAATKPAGPLDPDISHGTLLPGPVEESPSGASTGAADSQCGCPNAPVLNTHGPPPPTVVPSSTLDQLTQPLPLPSTSGLTHSQVLFTKSTGIDPRSLEITVNEEFWAFMDMQAEHQWATVHMTPRHVVLAVEILHVELTKWAIHVAKKQPSALFKKLAEIEDQIIKRIQSGNYTAENGTDTFWCRHCPAVPLGKAVELAEKPSTRKTKSMRCSHCRQLKYPGPEGAPENHKHEFCSDGIRIVAAKSAPADKPPPWPQPLGIFTDGMKFHPDIFLQHLHSLYDRVVMQREPSDDKPLPMEDQAFAVMAKARISLLPNDRFAFKLYADLQLVPAIPKHILTGNDGRQYLRVDCLSDSKPPSARVD